MLSKCTFSISNKCLAIHTQSDLPCTLLPISDISFLHFVVLWQTWKKSERFLVDQLLKVKSQKDKVVKRLRQRKQKSALSVFCFLN